MKSTLAQRVREAPAQPARTLKRPPAIRRRPRKTRRPWLGWSVVGLANAGIGWLLMKALTD